MKVLLLTDGIFPYVVGGMQKHSYYLAKYLPSQGIDLTVAHCIYDKNQALPSEKEVNQFLFPDNAYSIKSKAFYFPTQPIRFFGHYLLSSYQYSKILLKEYESELSEFDFIYAKGFCGWSLLKSSKKNKVPPPIGVNFHGYEMFQLNFGWMAKLKSALFRPFVSENMRLANYVFSYGARITELLNRTLNIDSSKIIELPAGIEIEKLRSADELRVNEKIKFLFVGRYEKRKGIDILNSAIKRVLSEQTDFEFHFVGPIPANMQLKKSHCFYHGLVREEAKIIEFYQQADVLVVPSFAEGMPNVIMEGMANGCSILATDVGAVSLLVDYNNGWLIDPHHKDLYEAIKKVLWSPHEEILAKKKKSIEKIAQFTWDKIAIKTAKAISK